MISLFALGCYAQSDAGSFFTSTEIDKGESATGTFSISGNYVSTISVQFTVDTVSVTQTPKIIVYLQQSVTGNTNDYEDISGYRDTLSVTAATKTKVYNITTPTNLKYIKAVASSIDSTATVNVESYYSWSKYK